MTASGKAAFGKEAAALALHRFGFGAVGDSIAAIATDPRGALLADLDRVAAVSLAVNLPSSGEAARAVFDFRAEQQARQKLAQRAKKEAEADGNAPSISDTANAAALNSAPPASENKEPPLPQQLIQGEARARFDAAAGAGIGFAERLVWFWSNHFCISADKIVAMAGSYEREAIRPHVLGRFADLLLAVESHPAMLFYLDNVESMGAGSIAGINRDKGLNENLAREILELHTLGVRSGYSQADVTSFANVLTGWTWVPPGEPDHGGEFIFNKRLHQPGDQIVLGKLYADTGIDQGRAVLADLARHPATAQHIAQKFARHFVADEPPPALIAKLAKTFKDSDGNLKELARTLVGADESWMPQRQKLKSPAEWVAGVLRLTGAPEAIPIGRVMNAQATLGEPLWRPPAPNGYSDTEASWIDGVPHRLDIANEFAGRMPGADPLVLLECSLGPLASPDTRSTVARAESRRQALALLVMTPEFLRR
ncbi:MAG TPA: DUF1800 family protein [Xanthobacteraceae bacterium]|nr:DUF1800 family protein [Xanthobacteraceae bacterium]